MAVRYGEDEFKDKLDSLLAKDRVQIEKIMDTYHIPRVPEPEQKFDLEGGDQ